MPFRHKEEIFNKLGIRIYDDKRQFRATKDILYELSVVWGTLSEIQQEYFANALFKVL